MRPIPADALARHALTVEPRMTVDFEQDDPRLGALHPVYATYWLVKHVELVGRKLTLPYLDPGEEGIGAAVEVRHLAPALPGMRLELEARLDALEPLVGGGWRVRAACRVTSDLGDRIGEGTTTQRILSAERIAARFEALRRRWRDGERGRLLGSGHGPRTVPLRRSRRRSAPRVAGDAVSGALRRETRGAVRLLTLARPEVRNAMNAALQRDLADAFDDAEGDAAVRAVLLTGEGRAFSAGLDLAELERIAERSAEENRRDSERFMRLLERIYLFPKPVVAALNGHAVAGGAGLASACDVTVASEDAKIGYTEARIGFVAALVGVLLVRQVGEKHARELLLGAAPVSAAEAHRMGLVNEVVPATRVLERGLERAAALAANAPTSLAMTKALLAAAPGMGLAEGWRYASELNALARGTDDLAEGIRAFLEKRKPRWRP